MMITEIELPPLVPTGLEWVMVAVGVLAVVAVVVTVLIVLVANASKRRALPAMPVPAQLHQADQLLAAGQIDPAEHAAIRNRILEITD